MTHNAILQLENIKRNVVRRYIALKLEYALLRTLYKHEFA